MAHNSAHYSLVNVGLDLCNVMMGVMVVRVKHPFVYRNPVTVPPAPAQIEWLSNHWYWKSLIFLFTSWRLTLYVIFQDPICLMWYWPTTPHLRSESHHEPTLAFSRYKELLGHKSREQIEMAVYTCHWVTESLCHCVTGLVVTETQS